MNYSNDMMRQQYRPVTAYTVTRPVLVNGYNINSGLYPVLNYKPAAAQYPYIYVPIAEFGRVGAQVVWDETRQVLTVTTNYYNNLNTIAQQRERINELQSRVESLQYEVQSLSSSFIVKFNGIENGLHNFSGSLWRLSSGQGEGFNAGECYIARYEESSAGSNYMLVINASGIGSLFSQPAGGWR